MASKSIIDRVLLLAAAVCAAGLIWQLSVLLTSKGKSPVGHGVEMASSAAAAPGVLARTVDQPQAKPDATPAKPDSPAVRVVYPDVEAPKTTAKITDPVPQAADPAPVVAAAPAPANLAPNALAPATGVVPVALVTPVPKAAASPAPDAPAATPNPAPDAAAAAANPAADTPQPTPASDQVASTEPAGTATPAADPKPAVEPNPAPGRTVNINSASIESLNRLHGGGHIGQAIMKHRPYKSVEDLVKRRVLRRDVFERIRNQIAAQ